MRRISSVLNRDGTLENKPLSISHKIYPGILLLLIVFITLPAAHAEAPYVPGVQDSVKNNPMQVSDSGLYETSLFTGAATYSYSINVPPGTNGNTPAVTLQYNSHNSLDRKSRTGAGWQLNMNYIKRIVNYTVDSMADDTFLLMINGQQNDLVYNASEGRYHTKEESYTKIEKKSTTSNDKGEYWEATAKDGTKYSFGLSTDSEIVNPSTNYVVYWYLTKITDSHGNEIYYTYVENPSANDISATYLDKIEYNNEKSRKIEFIRQNTNVLNPVFQYDEGMKVRYAMLHQEIRVSAAGGTRVSSYKLTYGLNDASTLPLLTKIQHYGSDGTSALPATTFTYNSTIPGWFNGTGYSMNFVAAYGEVTVDLNNDGLIDDVHSQIHSDGESEKLIRFNNGNKNIPNTSWIPKEHLVYHNLNTDDFSDLFQLFDVNADNYPDFIWSTGAYLNNKSGWENNSATQWHAPIALDGKQGVLIFDFNGDGYTDILQAKTTSPKAWVNTGNSWQDESGTWALGKQVSYVGDLNGDGLPDLIASDGSVYINTGRGWESSANWQVMKSITPQYGIKLADVNQDGLADILQGYYDCRIGPYVQYHGGWINKGTEWVRDDRWKPPITAYDFSHNPIFVRFIERAEETVFYVDATIIDRNGDGVPDIVDDVDTFYAKSMSDANKLKTITTSSGEIISIQYAPSTTFPNVGMGVVMQLVKNITRDNGMSSGHIRSTTSFNYEGGMYNFSDQEFRGFSRVMVTDALGRNSTHDFYQDEILKGREFKNSLIDPAGDIVKYSLNTWRYTSNRGINTIFLDKVQNFLVEGAASRETVVEYQYDNYGNVIKVIDKGDTTKNGDEKITVSEYSYNLSSWILDRVSKKTLFGPDGIARASEATYQYNGNGDLIRQEQWSDSGSNPVTQYVPDPYGNVESAINPRGFTSTFGYDATHTFMTQETNPLGHTISYQYDPGTGSLLQVTDPNGYITMNKYDVFGRIQKIIKQGDSESLPSITYQYFDSSVPRAVSITNREETGLAGTLNTRAFFDGFGQQVLTRQESETSTKEILTATTYDAVGRKTADIVPYFATTSTAYTAIPAGAKMTQYLYDSLDRPKAVINPDGTQQTLSYDLWTTTSVDENGNSILKENDVYGRIVAVEEMNEGDTYRTTYEYNPLDQVTKITDHGGNTFHYGYDSLGQKTIQDDPDSGHWIYTYDATGNLITQTDARGRTTTFSYDSLGRKTLTNYPTDTDIFNFYDETVKGTLSRVVKGSDTVSYTYDNRLRKTQETRVMDGYTWNTQYQYDDLDRVKSVTYPTGEVVQYSYTSRGVLGSVPGILPAITYNELGKITKKTFANSISTNLEYNTTDYRLKRILITGKQDLSYAYDNVGNVKSINDQIKGLSQVFTYDNLNRLTSADQSGGYGFITYEYTPLGNLVQKIVNGIGTMYTYGEGSAGPHAVTKQSSSLKPLPGYTSLPTDPDGDGIYEDLNGNGRLDFADVVLYFNQMTWIGENEPIAAFDLNGNGRIDFADIVQLFGEI